MNCATRLQQIKLVEQLEYRPPNEYKAHACDPRCCPVGEHSTSVWRFGPLVQPIVIGWRRIRKRGVFYIAPCGLSMKSIDEICRYLDVTKCQLLGVDNFCFERNVDCLREYVTDEQYVLSEDLSNGLEAKPIRVINEMNEQFPDKFTYVTQNRVHRDFSYDSIDHRHWLGRCECVDDCRDNSKCPCCQFALAGSIGYRYKRLNAFVEMGIYECNVNCQCSADCWYRVVQQPAKHHLEVFMTDTCGWGVRCRNDLPRGAFISCYLGNLLPLELSYEIADEHGDTYFATLDIGAKNRRRKEGYEDDVVESGHSESDDDEPPPKKIRFSPQCGSRTVCNKHEETKAGKRIPRTQYSEKRRSTRQFGETKTTEYLIDGKRYGNIGRFFNHSCEPNLFSQGVFVDTHDTRLSRLALFTARPVRAGTELCWDYNYEAGSIPHRFMECECKSKHCRGRLL